MAKEQNIMDNGKMGYLMVKVDADMLMVAFMKVSGKMDSLMDKGLKRVKIANMLEIGIMEKLPVTERRN